MDQACLAALCKGAAVSGFSWKEVATWIAWVIPIASLAWTMWKGTQELSAARDQRNRELRWKKAESARTLVHELFDDELAKNATVMLDWTEREFPIPNATATHEREVTTEEMWFALRTINTNFSDKEMYIRDCFDNLFYFISLIEQAIRSDLTDELDIEFVIHYIANNMNARPEVFVKYMEEYGYIPALQLLKRLGLVTDTPEPRPLRP